MNELGGEDDEEADDARRGGGRAGDVGADSSRVGGEPRAERQEDGERRERVARGDDLLRDERFVADGDADRERQGARAARVEGRRVDEEREGARMLEAERARGWIGRLAALDDEADAHLALAQEQRCGLALALEVERDAQVDEASARLEGRVREEARREDELADRELERLLDGPAGRSH